MGSAPSPVARFAVPVSGSVAALARDVAFLYGVLVLVSVPRVSVAAGRLVAGNADTFSFRRVLARKGPRSAKILAVSVSAELGAEATGARVRKLFSLREIAVPRFSGVALIGRPYT